MRAAIAMLLAALATPALADSADRLSAADRAAIRSVISQQIEAFKRDDGPGAFALASPGTQATFGSAARFIALVRADYLPVYRPRSVEFTKVMTEDAAIVQAVELVGPDGAPKTALYTMEHEPDGAWRIEACALTDSTRVGA
jgi:hypothetical protein